MLLRRPRFSALQIQPQGTCRSQAYSISRPLHLDRIWADAGPARTLVPYLRSRFNILASTWCTVLHILPVSVRFHDIRGQPGISSGPPRRLSQRAWCGQHLTYFPTSHLSQSPLQLPPPKPRHSLTSGGARGLFSLFLHSTWGQGERLLWVTQNTVPAHREAAS